MSLIFVAVIFVLGKYLLRYSQKIHVDPSNNVGLKTNLSV